MIILTDDQGYADVGFNPQHSPGITTPNIDKIARDGVMCVQAYFAATMCLAAAGLPVPPSAKLDGFNLLPLIDD